MSEPLLEIEDVTIEYQTRAGVLKAVSDASLSVNNSEYFGVVGESGCGKSTLANAIIGGLDENGTISSGAIRYEGQDIHTMTETELNEQIRWNEIAWIPQSSMNSLDPLKRVSQQAVELARAHTDLSKEEALDRFREMFEVVGLQESRITDYPHQYSGGMQQRAIIALALFLRPSLIIADEPTTALDVIMQDQIFKYLDQVKEQGVSMILITHDVSVVFESCDRMVVMHGGQTVETGTVGEIYRTPHHPYTKLLQDAFPDYRHPDRELTEISGEPPEQWDEVDYCTFANRCPLAVEDCYERAPPVEIVEEHDAGDPHTVSCYRQDEIEKLDEQPAQVGE